MKKFFDLNKYYENKFLINLNIVLCVLLLILTHELNLNYFSIPSSIMVIGIFLLTSLGDKEKYFNIFSFLATSPIIYVIFMLLFNSI